MPIIIQDYKWKETDSTVTIQVPLNGVHQSKPDIFYSENYIKASYEKYFFDVLLNQAIDITRSTCTKTSSHIIFELSKKEANYWRTLEPTDISKSEKFKLKQKYIEEENLRIQQEVSEKKNKIAELKRVAVREQMALDTKQREKITEIKEKEKFKALNDISHWQISNKNNNKKIKNASKKKSITIKIDKNTNEMEKVHNEIPALRSSRTLKTNFTYREFPTPCRESKLEEENEWLQKQAEARRSAGFVSEDIRPEERNPQFLKAKGDEFMRNNNYLGAISSYSFGIQMNEKYAELYVARAKAHWEIGNFMKTAQDCSTALDLMKPEVDLNLEERAFAIGQRGLALIKLGLIKEGIGELKASLKLVPSNHFEMELKSALDKLKSNPNNK